ncbi:MAG: DMT family transporter [Planctomycetota bacterium]
MHPYTGVAAALGSTLIWAYSSVLFQRAIARYGAFTCNMFKAFVGMNLFWLTVLVLGLNGDFGFGSVQGTWMLVISGLAGMAFGDWAYFAAIGHLGVKQATLLHGTAPLFLLLWSLTAPVVTLSHFEIMGVVAVVLGVSLVSWRAANPGGGSRGIGICFGGLAALGQATGILLSHQALQECHPLSGAAVRLSGAFLGLLLVQAFRGRLKRTWRSLQESGIWKSMLFPSFIGTFIGIFFMMIAIERSPPAVSGALLATTPIFVIPFAMVMLKEKATVRAVIGTAVVVAGVALVSFGMR